MSVGGKTMKRMVPAVIVAAMGLAVLWQATDGLAAFTTEAARRLKVEHHPVHIADVDLTDYSGRRITLPDGKLTLVEFIYTTCPTICQAAGDNFLQLRKRLQAASNADQIRMLSVSFDPIRDDNDQLAGYASLHGADGHIWTVARPRADAVPGLLKTFGITVIPDEFGGFQHNTAIHIVDRNGHLVAIVDTDDIERAAQIAESLL